jgi:3-oxoacyl-ACP reductase-like protein
MADNLVSDLIKRYRYENSQDEYRKKNHPDLDLLIVHVEKDMKEVFASRGDAVMYVRYHGNAKVGTVIDNVAEKIH